MCPSGLKSCWLGLLLLCVIGVIIYFVCLYRCSLWTTSWWLGLSSTLCCVPWMECATLASGFSGSGWVKFHQLQNRMRNVYCLTKRHVHLLNDCLTACCIREQLCFLYVLLTDVQGATRTHTSSRVAYVLYLWTATFPVCVLTDVQGAHPVYVLTDVQGVHPVCVLTDVQGATKTHSSAGATDVLHDPDVPGVGHQHHPVRADPSVLLLWISALPGMMLLMLIWIASV